MPACGRCSFDALTRQFRTGHGFRWQLQLVGLIASWLKCNCKLSLNICQILLSSFLLSNRGRCFFLCRFLVCEFELNNVSLKRELKSKAIDVFFANQNLGNKNNEKCGLEEFASVVQLSRLVSKCWKQLKWNCMQKLNLVINQTLKD